jgi:hypothetical protein
MSFRRNTSSHFMLSTVLSAVLSANASTPKVNPAAKLKAALSSAQTVFFVQQDVNMMGSAVDDPAPYKLYAPLYNGIQAMNRYQMLPSATGADLIFASASGSLNILDGKTFQLIGTLYINPFDLTAKKYTADIVKQLARLAGTSKASRPTVQQSLPPQAPSRSKLDPTPPSTLVQRLEKTHFLYILDLGTFPAPKKEGYQPGQMVEMLSNDLSDWGRYQIVPTLAGADLIVAFTTDNGCVRTGTTTTGRIGHTKTDVPDIRCDDKPSVGLTFLDAKTLKIVGYVMIDQPDMSIRPGQPNPKDVTFQQLITAWKSELTN